MAVNLKWVGDELYLGKTKMAEVKGLPDEDHPPVTGPRYRYVLGPSDRVSEPYQDKDDARQDCESVVRDMLARAGA